MTKQIRKSVFETNSSSTHSICIAKDTNYSLPQELHFKIGCFGWESSILDSISEKASYLYTGLSFNNRKEETEKIIDLLIKLGINVTQEELRYKKSNYNDQEYEYLDNDGYVDHSNELKDFLDDVCNNEEHLLMFLFSPLSFIITGNDNSDCDTNINVDYPHIEHYKGN